MRARTFLSVSLLLMSAGLALSCQRGVAPDCSSRRQGTSYHAHQTSCSLYYRCEDGHLETFSCGNGELFNEELQICDLAENVFCDRCELFNLDNIACPQTPTCTTNDWGKSKPYPPDCTKYISCDMYGNSILKSCTGTNEFSPTVNQCTTPANANCPYCTDTTTSSTSTTTSTTGTTPGTTTPMTTTPSTTTTSTTTTTTTTTSTTPAPTTEVAQTCPEIPTCSIPEEGFMKPYPPDCGKYLYCNHLGVGELSYCPVGLHFNVETSYCLAPELANCPSCVVGTTTVGPTLPICEPDSTCGPLDSGVTKPYHANCSAYIYCLSENNPQVRRCRTGTEFSPITNSCQATEIANCQLCSESITQPSITTPVTLPLTTTPTQPPTTTKLTSAPTTTSTLPPTTTTTKPPTTTPTQPPTTTKLTSAPTTTPTQPPTTTKPPTTTPTLPPTTTTESTTTLPACLPTPICTVLEDGLIKSYPPDCSKYILCNYENPILLTCLNDRHFSPVNNRCMEQELADCPLCSPELV